MTVSMDQTMTNSLEQHFLSQASVNKFTQTLQSICLGNLKVLEIGVGAGAITIPIIKTFSETKILGYEIDEDVCKHLNIFPSLQLIIKDATKEDYSFLSNEYCIISSPPYSLLSLIKNLIDKYKIQNALLFVSEKKLKYFPDFEVCFELSGEDFVPASTGRHFLIKRGFKNK